jgi:hypothetical protein
MNFTAKPIFIEYCTLENGERKFLLKAGKKLSRDAVRMESSITLLRKPQNSHKPRRLPRSLLKFDTGFGDTQ